MRCRATTINQTTPLLARFLAHLAEPTPRGNANGPEDTAFESAMPLG